MTYILQDNISNFKQQKYHLKMEIYLWAISSYVFCGILTEIPFIKRKLGLLITSIFIFSFAVLFMIDQKYYFYWLLILIISTNASTSLSISFVCESYPSKIRDLSQGFMNSIANFGSFAGQLIFISLYDINKDYFIYIYFILISFISLVSIFFIKKEMRGKSLDLVEEQ